MSDKDERGLIGEALAKVPLPEASERFVQKVMIAVRESEREKSPWFGLWRIPALGVGLAAVLFFALVMFQSSTETFDGEISLAPDDILQFALEEPGGIL